MTHYLQENLDAFAVFNPSGISTSPTSHRHRPHRGGGDDKRIAGAHQVCSRETRALVLAPHLNSLYFSILLLIYRPIITVIISMPNRFKRINKNEKFSNELVLC